MILKNEKDAMLLLEISAKAASKILRNGGEIYRVEDTAERIIKTAENVQDVDVFSTYNAVMLSFNLDGKIYSNIKRVKNRDNYLNIVNDVNTFSREFVLNKISLKDALIRINNIGNKSEYTNLEKVIFSSIAAGFYTVMFGGNKIDFIASFIIGIISMAITKYIEKNKFSYFFNNFISGFIVGTISIVLYVNFNIHIHTVIIGTIMPFVPGMVLTNSVRDLMSGDTNSGITGLSIAILISTALAFGVGLPLSIFIKEIL